jgi:hypothetical protein
VGCREPARGSVPGLSTAAMGRTRKDNMMAKYLLLKHYRGGPAPAVDWAPIDQWMPDEVDAHVQFMRDFAARLEETGEVVDTQALAPDGAFVRYDGEGRPPATDGPLVETKDLIAAIAAAAYLHERDGDPGTAARLYAEAADQCPASPNATTSHDRPHGSTRNCPVERRAPGIHRPDRDGSAHPVGRRTASLAVQETDIPCTSLLTSDHAPTRRSFLVEVRTVGHGGILENHGGHVASRGSSPAQDVPRCACSDRPTHQLREVFDGRPRLPSPTRRDR